MSRTARFWLIYALVVGTAVVLALVWLSNTPIARDDPNFAGFIGVLIVAIAGYAGVKIKDRLR